MTAYLIRRFFFGAILIFLATIVSFTIIKLSPGAEFGSDDPRVSQEYIEQQKRAFGLDKPKYVQYLNWLGVPRVVNKEAPRGILQGYLGRSMSYNQDVATVIGPRIEATLGLNIVSLALTWLVALPLGIYAAVRQYKLADVALSFISFVGMSAPGFFIALLLLWVFASRYHILPPGGLTSNEFATMSVGGKALDIGRHMVIPTVVLMMAGMASLQRLMRGSMLEVLRQQYIVTARAKGLAENRVIYKHALRNAINPMVTLLGFEFAALFGGAAILENVINFPGMGKLLLEALLAKDQFLIMSVFLIGSVMLVLGSLLADVLLVFVDPRVSYD